MGRRGSAGRQRALETQQYVEGVVHDLLQPISAIKLRLQLLRQVRAAGPLSPDELEARLDDLDRDVERLARTVRDILRAPGFARGGIQARPRLCDVRAIVAAIVGTRQPADVARVHLSHRGQAFMGFWDPVLLSQAIGNLVDNALKYSPEGSRVDILLEERADSVALHIRDFGPGVAPEDAPRLFERHYRAPVARAHLGSGTGLYAAKRIADAHHGHLWVESPGSEAGAVFHLLLPKGDL